jgi:hypothetical protein
MDKKRVVDEDKLRGAGFGAMVVMSALRGSMFIIVC